MTRDFKNQFAYRCEVTPAYFQLKGMDIKLVLDNFKRFHDTHG